MSLHVTIAGQGPRLVLLHGWGLNSRVWDSVRPRLSKSFTTVCIDLPGHGQSPWPPEFQDIDSLTHLIEPYVIGSECFLLGWSLGSMVAMALAAQHRALIRRLVLVAATPKFLRSPQWPNAMDHKTLDDMAKRVIRDLQGTLRDFLLLQVHGDEHARPALKALRDKVEAGGKPNALALKAGLDTLAKVDLRKRVADIDAPTLVIAGERDRLTFPRASKALADLLWKGQFLQIPKAAHAPFLSHEAVFCDAVENFLAGAS